LDTANCAGIVESVRGRERAIVKKNAEYKITERKKKKKKKKKKRERVALTSRCVAHLARQVGHSRLPSRSDRSMQSEQKRCRQDRTMTMLDITWRQTEVRKEKKGQKKFRESVASDEKNKTNKQKKQKKKKKKNLHTKRNQNIQCAYPGT
jgi:hypothetical protein